MSPSPPEAQDAPAEASEGAARGVQVRIVCSHCSTVVTRHSRKGYTVRCPNCGTVNAGPALIAEQAKPKDQAARRRMRRREARAERVADGIPPSPSAPAPVRRKRSAPAPAPVAGSSPAGENAGAPATPAPSAAPARGSFFDRLVYGEEDA